MQAFIYYLTMMRSKRYIQKTYGKFILEQFQPYQTLFFIKYPKNCRTSAIVFFRSIMPMHHLMWRGIGQCSS